MTGALVNRRGRRPVALAAIAAALLVSVAGPAAATEVGYARRYGLGLMVGTPTGLSGKAWVAPAGAIDAGIGGYGYGARGDCVRDPDGRDVCDRHWRGQRALSLHVDYLWHSRIVEHPTLQLDWHIGAGPRATFYGGPCDLDCWSLGARAPRRARPHLHHPRLPRGLLRARPHALPPPRPLPRPRRRPRSARVLLIAGPRAAKVARRSGVVRDRRR